MRTTLSLLFSVLLLALAACDTGKEEPAAPVGDAVATVNGEPVTETQLLHYAVRRAGENAANLQPQMKEQLLNELINIQLLAQEARSKELDEQSPLREQLIFQRDTAMADAAMTQYLEQNPITDEEVRAEYEQRKGELGGSEYKARHILVEEEATARDIIQQLENGAEFETLAKEHSIEPGADNSGGDLGWFSPEQMVPNFSAAVTAMEPGERSQEPVQTQFGWHVILLEDKREVEPPAFEQVQEQIRRFMMNQRIQDYLNELRANAEISREGMAAEDAAPAESETTETPASSEGEAPSEEPKPEA